MRDDHAVARLARDGDRLETVLTAHILKGVSFYGEDLLAAEPVPRKRRV
jgi:hypothetical protein